MHHASNECASPAKLRAAPGVRRVVRARWPFLAGACLLALAGCRGRPPDEAALAPGEVPRPGGTLRVLFESAHVFDPSEVDDAYEAMVVNQLYEGLVRLDSDLGIRPGLAQTWTVSEDGHRYRFILRPGVSFHDGQPLDAAVAVASLERAVAPQRRAPCLAETYLLGIEGAVDFQAGRTAHVAGLRALGRDTLEIRLARPLSYFLSVLCMDQLKIVPGPVSSESLNRHPVGTGPFAWVEQSPGGDIVLARHANYWGEKAWLDTLRFVVGGKDLTAADEVEWLRAGRVHVMPLPASQRAMLERIEGVQIVRFPDFSLTFIGLNAKHPPLDRLEVRQAIALALNREELVSPAARGIVNPATGILPPRMAGYQPEPKVLPYDPARARSLLAAAGFGAGRPVPPIDYYSSDADTSRYARELRRQLGEVGIRLTFHQREWAELDALIMAGRAPMFGLSWLADIPDPDAIFYFLFRTGEPNNLFGFSDASVDSLLDVGRTMTPGPKRFALYRQIESIVARQVPIIPTFSSTSLYVWHPTVRGVEPNPFGFSLTPYQKIWLTTAGGAEPQLTENAP